ncbi:MAG TPA: transporter associated domain-containing protein [Gammaproteobacteria bacterium]|nr:transporter associated domain-containing protein [Gammaproteobacteria bacterium]
MRSRFINKIRKWFALSPKNKDEIASMLKDATKKGILDNNTLSMLEDVLDVQETRVGDVMVPRLQMITLDYDMDLNTILPHVVQSGHSRFPVLGENKDEVLGIVLAKDLLPYSLANPQKKFDIRDVIRRVVVIPESKRLNVLLQDFRVNHNHLAMVVDEYGRITGLITIEDVLEQIVGEIEDEYDIEDTPQIRPQQDGGFTIKALTTVEEFNEFFKTDLDAENVETIGGLVTRAFGHLPKRGECVQIEGFYFTVMRADNRRIHLLSMLREGEPSK